MADPAAKPKEPAPLSLVNVETGKSEDVPYAEAHQRLLSGQSSVAKGEELPVRTGDGFIVTAPLSDLPAIVKGGGRLATKDEYTTAEKVEKYRGPGQALAAGAAGFADTATFGIVPGIAGAVSKDAGTYLTEVQEAHPVASGIGQGLGIVAPIAADVLSGGLATPLVAADVAKAGLGAARALEVGTGVARGVEGLEAGSAALKGVEALGAGAKGVEAAGGAAQAAEAARLAATPFAKTAESLEAGKTLGQKALGVALSPITLPQRGVSAIGGVAERAVQKLAGTEATSLAGQMAQRAAAVGAKGLAEGAVIGAAHEASEDLMHHTPEGAAGRILAGGFNGALLGAGFGGALGALGPLARRGMTRLADSALTKVLDSEGHLQETLGRDGIRKLTQNMVADGVIQAGDSMAARGEKTAEKVVQRLVKAEGQAVADKVAFYARVASDEILPLELKQVAQKPVLALTAEALPTSVLAKADKESQLVLKQAQKAVIDANGLLPEQIMAAAAKQQELVFNANKAGNGAEAWKLAQRLEPARKELVAAIEKEGYSDAVLDRAGKVGSLQDKLEYLASGAKHEFVERQARLPMDQASGLVTKLGDLAESPGISADAQGRIKALRSGILSHVDESFAKGLAEAKDAMFEAGNLGVSSALGVGTGLQALQGQHAQVAEKAMLYTEAKIAVAKTLGIPVSALTKEAQRAAMLSASEKTLGLGGVALAAAGQVPHLGHALGIYGGAKLAWRGAKEGYWRAASIASVAAERLSSIAEVERAAKAVERRLATKVDDLMLGLEKGPAFAGGAESKAPEWLGTAMGTTFDQRARAVMSLAAEEGMLSQRVEQATGLLAYSAPQTAKHIELGALRTVQYLAETLPHPKANPSSLTGESFPVPDGEKAKWLRRYDVAVDPIHSLNRLENDSMTPEERETWMKCHPDLHGKAVERLKTAVLESNGTPAAALAGGAVGGVAAVAALAKGAKKKAEAGQKKAISRSFETGIKKFAGVPLLSPATSRAIGKSTTVPGGGGGHPPRGGGIGGAGGGPIHRPLTGSSKSASLDRRKF